jgi:Tol biopolymer transport system component
MLTGELYAVTEVATDGRAVRWSPDGRYAAFESGTGADPITHLLEVRGSEVIAETSLPGSGLVFSPARGRAAYLRVDETPSFLAARERIQGEYGGTDRASRMRLRNEMSRLETEHTVIVARDLASGVERQFRPPDLAVSEVFYSPDNAVHFLGSPPGDGTVSNVYRTREDGSASAITDGPGQKTDPFLTSDGSFLVYGLGRGSFAILEVGTGKVEAYEGSFPVVSADGGTLAYLVADGTQGSLNVLSLEPGGITRHFRANLTFTPSTSSSRSCPSCPLQSGLALSPDGHSVVVQGRPREDWELFLVSTDGSGEDAEFVQITREIQHDLYPTFLADGRLLAMKGEGRHRRSHLYDLETGEKTWLFRNNTVRTVAPEYEWAPSPDGSRLLLVAERDGNTVSPERGVYLMDLTRKVTAEELLERVRRNLEAERELRALAGAMYAPMKDEIQAVVDRVSITRIFEYEEALFQFGSKNVSQPGNQKAIEYIAGKLREFGYEPELQWFDARGSRSANVIARIPGTVSPDVVYAVSAHFDSNNRSPGADDNTSATVGLIEMARALVDHPLPATVEIALFTGEESGLLGSREYVRRAVESEKQLVGALNNDMVGFAEDHRLDNTIRYSNAGIRDLQHGAAILFSEMITHDAEYYKSTDNCVRHAPCLNPLPCRRAHRPKGGRFSGSGLESGGGGRRHRIPDRIWTGGRPPKDDRGSEGSRGVP